MELSDSSVIPDGYVGLQAMVLENALKMNFIRYISMI